MKPRCKRSTVNDSPPRPTAHARAGSECPDIDHTSSLGGLWASHSSEVQKAWSPGRAPLLHVGRGKGGRLTTGWCLRLHIMARDRQDTNRHDTQRLEDMSTSHTRSPSACLSWSAAWVRSAQQRPLVMTPLGGSGVRPSSSRECSAVTRVQGTTGLSSPNEGSSFDGADPWGTPCHVSQPGVPDAAVDAPSGGRMRGIPAGWLQRARCTPRHTATCRWPGL